MSCRNLQQQNHAGGTVRMSAMSAGLLLSEPRASSTRGALLPRVRNCIVMFISLCTMNKDMVVLALGVGGGEGGGAVVSCTSKQGTGTVYI